MSQNKTLQDLKTSLMVLIMTTWKSVVSNWSIKEIIAFENLFWSKIYLNSLLLYELNQNCF